MTKEPATLSDPGPLPELNWPPVDRLRVDARYQRSLETARSQSHVRNIAENFRWIAFQAILAVKDGDGWLVIDGQHRVAAARLRGYEHVPAVVVAAAGLEEQASAFIQANRQRVPVNQFAVFHAMVASGDPVAKRVASICEAARITIPRYQAAATDMPKGTTLAVATLLNLTRRYGPLASLPIEAVAAAYNDMRGGLRAPFFDGAARYIFAAAPEDRDMAAEHAKTYFAAKAPDEVFAAMAARCGQGGAVSRGQAIAELIRASALASPTKAAAPERKPAKAAPAPARKTRFAPLLPRTIANAKPQIRKVDVPRPDEDDQIAAFIAKNGVTTSVDFGVHQDIVDAARARSMDIAVPRIFKGARRGSWFLNGYQCDTKELYKRVNLELERRGQKPIVMPKEAA